MMIWSISLNRTWERCQRQFFFQHLMANTNASDPQRNLAQMLSQIWSQEIWQGKIVHSIIETHLIPMLKTRQWPRPQIMIDAATKLAIQQFDFSLRKDYLRTSRQEGGINYCILAEHYFEDSISTEPLDETISVISRALENLVNSSDMQNFLRGRKFYRAEQICYFQCGETKVQAIPDLIMLDSKRLGFDIIDWKVGSISGGYNFQVAAYALAIKATDWLYRKAPGEFRGYVVNLLEPDPAVALLDPYLITDDVLLKTEDIVFEKIEAIDALVQNRGYKDLDFNAFMLTHSPKTCTSCNWKSMCMEMSNGTPVKLLPDQQSTATQLTLPIS